jgi:Uma2 family endonuclease
MASTHTLIPVEEYLRTVYRPDCDYIDGEVFERNMGETPHARLQAFFTNFFRTRDDEWNVEVLPEQRLQISQTCYRIPDVMVVALPNLDERIIRTAPLLCIEILSSEDRMKKVEERIADYASIGVRASWVIDPWRELAYSAGSDGAMHPQYETLRVDGTQITIAVSGIFEELRRLERRAAGNQK